MFEKEFINQLKRKYKNGGTGTNLPDPPVGTGTALMLANPLIGLGYQGYKMYKDEDYRDKVIKTSKDIYTKGKDKLKNVIEKFKTLTTPKPLTKEQESLSYLSDIEGTSIYNKLQKLSDSKKRKLYHEYKDIKEETEGFGDLGFRDQISKFKNLDLSDIKELQNTAGISKDELRTLLYSQTGYHDMPGWKKLLMKGALSAKGFKRGGVVYRTGGTQLEGGVMLPIPNSNAVEFKGNTHEQGGIMLDEKTEVENDEVMTKVHMKKGGIKDYFFSSHLKKGGLSFAEMSKDILKNGGTQKEINILAKMQETAAKRNPKQIARLGGVVKYSNGGIKEQLAKGTCESGDCKNGQGTLKLENGAVYIGTFVDGVLEGQGEVTYGGGNKYVGEFKNGLFNGQGTYTWGEGSNKGYTYEGEWKDDKQYYGKTTATNGTITQWVDGVKIGRQRKGKNFKFINKETGDKFRKWINETYPEYAKEIDLDESGSFDNTYIRKAYKKYGTEYSTSKVEEPSVLEPGEFEKGTYTDPEGNIYERGRTGQWRVRWNKATIEGIPEFGEIPQDLSSWEDMQEGFDPSLSGALTKFEGTMPKIEKDEEFEELTPDQQTLFDKIKDRAERKSDVPAIAAIAGTAQLGPALYSLLHKQPPAEQAQYTRGFTSPIVAGIAKAPTLDRVNYNAERANNAAQMREINKYIETSGGGPANIINKMMAYGKKQQGDMLIAGAETKANTAIANQEAAMKGEMAVSNLTRAQQAATVNAQLQQGETARMDQINLANAAARQAVKDDEEFQKYQGVAALGTNLAGLAGDLMSYTASERMARVMGSEGIYSRDIFRQYALKEIKKSGIPGVCGGNTGIPCTDDHINKFITSQNKEKEKE